MSDELPEAFNSRTEFARTFREPLADLFRKLIILDDESAQAHGTRPEDWRHIAGHAVLHLLEFVARTGANSVPNVVVQSLHQLILAFDTVDRGRTPPLFKPDEVHNARNRMSRTDEVFCKDWIISLMEYRTKSGMSRSDAAKNLAKELKARGAAVDATWIESAYRNRAAIDARCRFLEEIGSPEKEQVMLDIIAKYLPV